MKDTQMSVMIMGIPDPTSSVGSHHQWAPTRQMTTDGNPTKSATSPSQWSDQDIDDFVRQLSNPQHPVSKLGSSASTTTPLDSATTTTTNNRLHPKRAPLARSETDSSVHFIRGQHGSGSGSTIGISSSSRSSRPSSESGSSSTSSSIGGGLLSGLSGLRLLKNKKLARSSQANAKKYATQKSLCHDDYTPSRDEPATAGVTVVDHPEESSPSNGDGVGCNRDRTDSTGSGKNSAGHSSPEGSDGEKSDERKLSDPRDGSDIPNNTTTARNAKEGKKRLFRRMLSRPLSRSQSAGCAKDVPAHALFLREQRKDSDEISKNSTTSNAAIRKERSSDGDIRHLPVFDDDEEEEDDYDDNAIDNTNTTTTTATTTTMTTSRSSSNIGGKSRTSGKAGGLRKMESMDASLLMGGGSSTDEFGVHDSTSGKHKHRNYNIAKKISRHMQFLRRRHTDTAIGVMDKEETKRLCDLDPAHVQEWSKSFESLLFDKNGLELFRGFLVSEHSDENIEFWIACEKYKLVKSHKQLAPLANKIFNDYVAVQSRREVNLDSTTRNSTFEGVTSNPSRQTFDDAQKRVQALMEKDSYRRFLESELYVDLASGSIRNKQHS